MAEMTEATVRLMIVQVLRSLRARLNRGQDLDEALVKTIHQYSPE